MITGHQINAMSFKAVRNRLRLAFKHAHDIHTGTWQGVSVEDQPAARMVELLNTQIHVPQVPSSIENLARDLEGSVNLPWAENHFSERVSGQPMNPGTEWMDWADGDSAANFLNSEGKFNHNYMERLWPKFAGHVPRATVSAEDHLQALAEVQREGRSRGANLGIRWRYGDLSDVVTLMARDPLTRQAWIPLFFPEDTGIGDGDRKPCTLGYQFILREGKLHTYYPLRSCDFYRHWGDDVYMAVRLAMWALDTLRHMNPKDWKHVSLGSYTMHCTSLHMFINDYRAMEKQNAQG